MFLIAGLGNPGRRYKKTRHNVGFMLVDRIAEELSADFDLDEEGTLVSQVSFFDQEVLLAKPQRFMNASGPPVRKLLRTFDVELSETLIVYDEIALPLGRVRLRASGSGGGHKGMQSIIGAVGSLEIPRLRIGIGCESPVEDLSRYVLSNFSGSELRLLEEVFDRSLEAIGSFLAKGIGPAMSLYNCDVNAE